MISSHLRNRRCPYGACSLTHTPYVFPAQRESIFWRSRLQFLHKEIYPNLQPLLCTLRESTSTLRNICSCGCSQTQKLNPQFAVMFSPLFYHETTTAHMQPKMHEQLTFPLRWEVPHYHIQSPSFRCFQIQPAQSCVTTKAQMQMPKMQNIPCTSPFS